MDDYHARALRAVRRTVRVTTGGEHGYDGRYRSMHGLFVAAGPQFRRGIIVPAFESIHVYELMCRILGQRGTTAIQR